MDAFDPARFAGGGPDTPEPGWLDLLEDRAIGQLRAVERECARPALYFSGRKGSLCLLRLLEKSGLSSARFRLFCVESGREFLELVKFRTARASRSRFRLEAWHLGSALVRGALSADSEASRASLRWAALKLAQQELGIEALVSAGRADECRSSHGPEEPRRDEATHLPLHGWSELEIWSYICREGLAVPSLYLSHRRVCVDRHGVWLPVDPHAPPAPQERLQLQQVRTNCILDRSQTQFTPSAATTAAEVVAELRRELVRCR